MPTWEGRDEKGRKEGIVMRKILFTYLPALLLLAFLAMILVACGGDDDGGGGPVAVP